MIENKKLLKYLEKFSIITVGENKVPNFPWKKQQTERLSKENLLSNYSFSGSEYSQKTTNFGIVTGFED